MLFCCLPFFVYVFLTFGLLVFFVIDVTEDFTSQYAYCKRLFRLFGLWCDSLLRRSLLVVGVLMYKCSVRITV
ncbi:hypothetical protein Hanom_Chr02g00115071 [Helianthus anomalus]